VWDDSVARIAHHRAVHEIDAATPGLGPQPLDPRNGRGLAGADAADVARSDLADRPPARTTSHPHVPVATEMHDRRAELQALMRTAPADHRELIERLTAGNVGSAEVHEHLVAATTAQQDRRDWIVANWPYVVELEQLNALINTQPALAHWPTATPPPVQAVLDAVASCATPPPAREQRTLAALDQRPPRTTRSARPKPRSATSTSSPPVPRRAPSGLRSTRPCGQLASNSDRLVATNSSTTSSPDTAAARTTTPSSDGCRPWATTS
jgi:hypothetical protein